MARKVAIVVGIKKIKGLPELPGAVLGANNFAKWATQLGYEVSSYTDDGGKPVSFQPIYDSVRAVVDAGDASRLLVYFSGHGLIRGYGMDYWLLSNAADNPNEAIAVTNSVYAAGGCGIPHVAFIADACRTMAGKDQLGIQGSRLFPNLAAIGVQLDQFYGTKYGAAAQEVVPDQDISKAYGVFSKCLSDALDGKDDKAFDLNFRPDIRKRYVTSQSLATYLEEEVPRRQPLVKGSFSQQPECHSGARPPINNIYLEVSAGPAPALAPHLPAPSDGPRPNVLRRAGVADSIGAAPQPEPPRYAAAIQKREQELADEVLALKGRESFETATGMSVVNARILEGYVTGSKADVFQENQAWHVRGHNQNLPQSCVLRVDGNRWVTAPLIPGFIGTVKLDGSGVGSLIYLPAYARLQEKELREAARRALATANAQVQFGRFTVATTNAKSIADSLRQYKQDLPTLGIFAAYAYQQVNDVEQIRSIARWIADVGQAIPFDVALLGRMSINEDRTNRVRTVAIEYRGSAPLAGSFPLMTQGWMLMPDEHLHPAVRKARAGLARALWATPTGQTGEGLAEAVFKGEL